MTQPFINKGFINDQYLNDTSISTLSTLRGRSKMNAIEIFERVNVK
jgi:hypothetical protein